MDILIHSLLEGATRATGKKFEKAMADIYSRAVSECDYRPSFFLQMLKDRGSLGTANALLAGKPSDGFGEVRQLGRLDLSVEALVIQEDWCSMTTNSQLLASV